ncbi:hypothetical protein NP233_g4155 [Leucocoprinus birnbaumii]|uniref:MFS general substrate transporter n=1 Tax=Leucocoprinus birnbaumii TaxID=56174 RepID=A0AAD5VXY3_9AGAR|nr:hypothetical protein NP233_g4155 [Leucocoprinus birnbaumii]
MTDPSTSSIRATDNPLVETQSSPCQHEVQTGSFHQEATVSRAKRHFFFSPLDQNLADAVHKDAERVQYTPEEERKVRRKIDNTVLPLVIVSESAQSLHGEHQTLIVNQFDRTNMSAITTNQKWTIALSIFYVGYCLLEMPANIAGLGIKWSETGVLMGIGEAGYYAGVIYYLSFWYKRSELAVRISLGMTGTLPGAVGGLLAFGLVRAQTSQLTGWQFLFLVEAIPTIIMGTVVLFLLPSFPFSASFLSPRERAIAQARLNRDHKPQSHGGMTGWQGFKAVIADPNAWLFMMIYASFNVGVATISYFLPTLIKDLGFSSINAQGLTVAPYVVGWFMVYLQSWHSDYTKDRGYHIMFSAALSLIGYIILATAVEKSVGAAYFALFLVVGGNYSLFPLVMSWAANTFSPTSKRGVGTAFVVSISNCVSIASPQVYFDPEDSFRKGHAISAGCLALCILTAFVARTRLHRMNKRNQNILQGSDSSASREEDGKGSSGNQDIKVEIEAEIWDNDPRYVFLT